MRNWITSSSIIMTSLDLYSKERKNEQRKRTPPTKGEDMKIPKRLGLFFKLNKSFLSVILLLSLSVVSVSILII